MSEHLLSVSPFSMPMYRSCSLTLTLTVFSNRFAEAFFFPASAVPDLQVIPWGAKYIHESSPVRYISLEHRKLHQRNKGDLGNSTKKNPGDGFDEVKWKEVATADPLVAVLAHTSVLFGIQHGDDAMTTEGRELIQNLIMQEVRRFIPPLRKHVPLARELLYWKHSQVTDSSQLNSAVSGVPYLTIHSDAAGNKSGLGTVYFTSDYFTSSNFEGCLKSAHAAAQHISQLLLLQQQFSR